MTPARTPALARIALAALLAGAVAPGAAAQTLLTPFGGGALPAALQEGAGEASFEPAPARPPVSDESCAAAAELSERAAGRALLVMVGEDVVFERYANGWEADRPHPLASGTKSFTGVLAAAAVADGLIDDLDAPAARWIDEWADDPRKSRITVRQLLDLSSGLVPEHPALGRRGYGINDLGPRNARVARLRTDEAPPADRFAAAVHLPTVAEPGAGFAYGPSHFYAFGEVLRRALAASERSELSVFEYLRARVLVPAGVDVGLERFGPDAAGRPGLPAAGHLTAREWAAFGRWVLRGGAHLDADGALVRDLPAGALEALFEPSAANPAYGLTWWLGAPGGEADGDETAADDAPGADAERERAAPRPVEQPVPARVVMAAGAGKQRLYLLPELDLVVVRFAEQRRAEERFDDARFLAVLLDRR